MSDITKKYKKYKIKTKKETMESYCTPNKFKLQPQQSFLAEYFTSKNAPDGMLVFHQIGAGKTCAAISVAEKMKKKYKILVVLPAALIGNFMDELISSCPGENEYITKKEGEELLKLKYYSDEYKAIIEKTKERISKYYTIYSYHKFVELAEDNKIKLKNTLLIVDEVQNMVSLTGTFYRVLKKQIDKTDDTFKILILSATPMFDRPNEIGLTLNLLKPKEEFPIGCDFNQTFLEGNGETYNLINTDKFINMSKNLVSYYRGAPPYTYPEQIFRVVKCKMSDFQYKSYLTALSSEGNYVKGSFRNVDILNLPVNFFLGPRMVSNVAFPNKGIGELGFSSFDDDNLLLQNIIKFSAKFYKILKKIKKSEGPVFIYSNFKDLGGLRSLIKFIEYHGYKNYKVFGEGPMRYSTWSGDETHQMKEEIKKVFNQKENEDGSRIRLMLGSPSVKEGVSFKRVRQVHILEPYWNMSRVLQIIGRAIRFCSHNDLPKKERNVDVYLYLATYPGEETIDQYIWSLAKEKSKLIQQFETALKEVAVDCELFYNRNVYPSDEYKLKCKND
jgi:superfamily II DNA or RNA helicase